MSLVYQMLLSQMTGNIADRQAVLTLLKENWWPPPLGPTAYYKKTSIPGFQHYILQQMESFSPQEKALIKKCVIE